MTKLLLSSLIVLLAFQYASSSRILAMVPTPSYSHQVFYHQLWREFAIRGHEIVVITTDPTNETLPNFKEISIREAYGPMKVFINTLLEESMVTMLLTNKMMNLTLDMHKFTFELPQVQQLIKNTDEHFDLVMVEHFWGPVLGLQHRFNCPMIGVISLDGLDISHEIMGNPVHSTMYPISLANMNKEASILRRTISWFVARTVQLSFILNGENMNKITRGIFGEDTPDLIDIMEKTEMMFMNANPVLNAIRPHAPSTISIAGIHMKPAKPLPKDLQHFLDNSKEGAIYFSLGSNVKSNELTMEMRSTIMDTLRQLPYKVLWKFEDDNLEGKPDNVHLVKWTPQQDVLRHKNVKLFITQGGLQSLEEALYSHVPMVVIPFIADQEGNAIKIQDKGLGLMMDRNNLNLDDFKHTILEVMENPVYRDTVALLATQIQDTPMAPLERAIWWTEYVIRHKGAQHLKGPRIPFYQYYYLDVLCVLGGVSLVALGFTFAIVRFCIRKVCGVSKCCKAPENDSKLKKVK